ncbi:predicted protein [Postia placenta Mad-698-R]|nr:predicted protein [Postia placenta Mad-698-R]
MDIIYLAWLGQGDSRPAVFTPDSLGRASEFNSFIKIGTDKYPILRLKLGHQANSKCKVYKSTFLPQDKVSEFAQMSPRQLLREMQRAAGNAKYIEAKGQYSKTQTKQRNLQERVLRLQAKNASINERKTYRKNSEIEKLEAKSENAKTELENLKSEKDRLTKISTSENSIRKSENN